MKFLSEPHPREPTGAVSSADLVIMRHLDRLHLEFPFAGSRMLRGLLALQWCKIGRRHVKTLMRRMGMEALYRRRAPPSLNLSEPRQSHGCGNFKAG
jgi:hypothetical protein